VFIHVFAAVVGATTALLRENIAESDLTGKGRENAFKELPSIESLLLSALASCRFRVNGWKTISCCQRMFQTTDKGENYSNEGQIQGC
jgi:hypothetical protein